MTGLFTEGELASHPTPLQQQAADIYNLIAKDAGWRRALVLDAARRKAIARAVKDYGGLAGFRSALERASKSAFLTGKAKMGDGHEGWRPTLDFFLQAKSIRNLLEGVYDDREAAKPKRTWREQQVEDAKAAVERLMK